MRALPAAAAFTLLFFLSNSLSVAEAAKLLVPAYWDTYGSNACTTKTVKGLWNSVVAGGSNVIAIINPIDGPDYSGDDATVTCLPHLTRANVTTIGYVATGYGQRALADIQKDISQWKKVYGPGGMTGIFFDEGVSWWDSNAAIMKFYASIASYARAAGFTYLVVNPGTRFPPQLLDMFDTVVGYESVASDWKNGNNQGICQPPSASCNGDAGYCKGTMNCDISGANCRQAKPGQIAALVFCQPAGSFQSTMNQARQAGYGAVYLTQNGCRDTNPWAKLPSYWTTQMAMAQK